MCINIFRQAWSAKHKAKFSIYGEEEGQGMINFCEPLVARNKPNIPQNAD
jgi:hypothetical protein